MGYEHVAIMTRTAERVGTAAVQKAESALLAQAQVHDPGHFVTIATEFEHREDAEAALRESNRAFSRRWTIWPSSAAGTTGCCTRKAGSSSATITAPGPPSRRQTG
ncbi:MAG: hypothetical protein ABI401_04135 [Candidatus Dormibacter sp.]